MDEEWLRDEKKLSRELETAVQKDLRRKAVDDMKKRSVLTASSYDQFRHLVACAQDGQKPVSSKEMEFVGKPGRREGYMYSAQRKTNQVNKWGNRYRSVAKKEAMPQQMGGSGKQALVPTTSQEFDRFWRRKDLGREDRFNVVIQIDASKVFKVELNELGEILDLLNFGLTEVMEKNEEEAERTKMVCQVVQFLHQLTQVERFPLAEQFLNKNEKQLVESFLISLQDKVVGGQQQHLNAQVDEIKSIFSKP